MSLLPKFVDERFMAHRRQSTSIAGMISAALALVLFEYRYFHDGVFSKDLLAVGLTFVALKFIVMGWHYLKA
jgi:hypothetical protein